jgi:hypothetical protein
MTEIVTNMTDHNTSIRFAWTGLSAWLANEK